MNNIGRFLFLHFEKGLVGLLFLGFAYSLIWYGPWRGGSDYVGELDKLSEELDKKQPAPAPAAVEDLYAKLTEAGKAAVAEQPLADNLLWPLSKSESPKVLPPTDVSCKPDRGYIAVNWEVNPTQLDMGEALQFVGVQVDRAAVTAEGPGPFVTLTRVAEGQDFMTPTQLYALVQKVAPVTLEKETKDTKDTKASPSAVRQPAPYSVDDLFNAVHDGVLTIEKLRSMVEQGFRRGVYSMDDRMAMNETFLSLSEAKRYVGTRAREERRAAGKSKDAKAAPKEPPKSSGADNLKIALELIGYRGGGEYVKQITTPENTVEAVAATPEAPAPEAKPDEPRVVMWGEVSLFADTNVNPELEYRYRVRFWAVDTTSNAKKLITTDWSQETGKVSPKPDTEFFLTGLFPDQGRASIMVRKWMFASNSWETRTYYLGPAEQIGRAEVLPRRDTAGRTITDADGNAVVDTVDFSTGCVMLSARSRPKGVEIHRTVAEATATGEIKSVDIVDYVLYDTPQIVYANRKGDLFVKWKAPPEES